MSNNRRLRIFLAGHRGLVGAAIDRRLMERDVEVIRRTRDELNLTDQQAVHRFLAEQRPDVVIMAAAKVGGIHANSHYPGEFIYENLMIACNVIAGAHAAGVKRLLNLGSSCIYPKHAAQPITEDSLLTGALEPTNEPYAVAKISAIKLCESYNRQYGVDYRSVMPTNLYGPGDNFHPENAHVLPALMRRFHEAVRDGVDEVVIWGTGTPRREFLHVDDMADACLFVLDLPKEALQAEAPQTSSHLNVGCGSDIAIAELATMLAEATSFRGQVRFDRSRPDGTMRKLLDVSRLDRLGWRARISLEQGIRETYAWFLANEGAVRV